MRKPSAHTTSRHGFTLTELLVAIALLLIIMVSVATIFRSSSDAAGIGIAITAQNRALASAGQQFQQDITGYNLDPTVAGSGITPVNRVAPGTPPFLFIQSMLRSAYRDQAAEDAANRENFRLDSMGFFAEGIYRRQTGGGYVVDEMPNFTNAYIWYGHLSQPDSTGGYNAADPTNSMPGLGSRTGNPNNYYAKQWILGRRAILLADVINAGLAGEGTVNGGYYYYARRWDTAANAQTETTSTIAGSQWDSRNFAPLGNDIRAGMITGAAPTVPHAIDTTPLTTPGVTPSLTWPAFRSRLDMAGLNREQEWDDYARLVQHYQTNFEANAAGYGEHFVKRYFSTPYYAELAEKLDIDWSQNTVAANRVSFLDAATQSVPVMLRNCTNFIVEFAGDYCTQNANGTLSGVHPALSTTVPASWMMDGVIDFDLVPVPNSPIGTESRQIRWYGMPRDVNGDNTISLLGAGDTVSVTQMRQFTTNPGSWSVPFERWEFSGTDFVYRVGWTPDMLSLPATLPPLSLAPRLIRITVQVSDPQGRVIEDMTRQYVFPVKYE